jgi:hypothetical protein
VFDVTALGAGFETNQELSAKDRLTIDATITTSGGCDDVTLPIVVRNVRQVSEERWRVGVEFVDPAPASINPLVAYCMIEPARQRLSGVAGATSDEGSTVVEAVAHPVLDGRRLALRLISLAAVGGAIASARPTEGTLLAGVISVGSILIAAGVLAGSARPRRARWTADQSTSSPSPDLAIR